MNCRKRILPARSSTLQQHESTVKLLTIFAQHLAIVSNQVFIQQENAEMPVIKRAKEYIREHQAEKISLGNVAKAVNMSAFYFCKMFKKVAGINFTDYLSRVRIEKRAKPAAQSQSAHQRNRDLKSVSNR